MGATRIDSHQHFWSYDPVDHAWMVDGMEALRRDFDPTELLPELEAFRMDGCVAVQARQSLAETHGLLELARKHSFVRGVVGWVDLGAPDIDDQLDRLADERALVGIRHIVQDEPDDRFVLTRNFQRGIAALAGRGLVYDVLIYPRQLSAAIELVELFPEQDFVLDHLAKPFIKDGRTDPWSKELHTLGALKNVTCKVSGMVTEADWEAWTPEQLAPFMDVALEAFGPRRLMYGSDWPVCLLASDYARMAAATNAWAETRLSPREREGFFGETAVRVYGL